MSLSKRHLIDEQTSPLHRIMWVYNIDEPQRRGLENNICAFHIGNGYFLSVAHNLRLPAGYFKSIDEELYNKELLYKLDGTQKLFFDQHFFTDSYTRKLYLNTNDQGVVGGIAAILKQKRFDTRWVSLAQKGICTPHILFQFREHEFYGRPDLMQYFPPERQLIESEVHMNTFFVPLQLVHAFYSADIALYKVIDTPQEVIDAIPAIDINFDFMEDDPGSLHCLQSAPSSPLGRLLNDAHIEGILDHFGIFVDEIGGNYVFDGLRYLVKGYFRFGSSGAPYVVFDEAKGRWVANAVQSEASGIQLSIKNDREGNFQYVNAIVSPLYIIKDQLLRLIGQEK